MASMNEIATFAGGCFWCTEAIFKRLKGVERVESGYTGGDIEYPSYDQVSMGNTNHAEAIEITYNPKIITFEKLVQIFFHTHNPTTLNQQGADYGTQYRSAIFYHDENQKRIVERIKNELEKENKFGKPIVTRIEQYKKFYKAEPSHQEYYERNKDYPYCTLVIDPKIKKLMSEYGKDVKEEFINS